MRNGTKQLEKWKSKFGDDYVQRNEFEPWKLKFGIKAFQNMIGKIRIKSILEVGSNVGLNLIFLDKMLNSKIPLHAVEPNKNAFNVLSDNKIKGLIKAYNTDSFNLPFESSSIDLVFTCGVLIHIDPIDLKRATDEIVRVSKEYVLCAEYFSHEPEEELYRGHEKLLFKRDFGSFYLDNYTKLGCIDYGFLWQRDYKIYDDVNWWLLKKQIINEDKNE